MKPVQIPRRVDEPIHVLLWALDDMAPIFIGLMFGVFVNAPLSGALGGMVAAHFYTRFKDNHADGFALHALYWLGLPIVSPKARSLKNPYIREFLP